MQGEHKVITCRQNSKKHTKKSRRRKTKNLLTDAGAEMVKNIDQEVINLKLEMMHMKSVIQQKYKEKTKE